MWGRPNKHFDHRRIDKSRSTSFRTTIIISPYRDRVIGRELETRTGCGVSSSPRPKLRETDSLVDKICNPATHDNRVIIGEGNKISWCVQ